MNILSMLVRLQSTLGCDNLAEQMVLLPQQMAHSKTVAMPATDPAQEINLVVGYNHSSGSQTALDLTLWIAHQTRLATGKQVTVQVVYVIDKMPTIASAPGWRKRETAQARQRRSSRSLVSDRGSNNRQNTCTAVANPDSALNASISESGLYLAEQFEQADRILWQARCLAEEWRGSLKTHLRIGAIGEELKQVVVAESAALLLLGCSSLNNAIVQTLGKDFPCPVLGIPTSLNGD